MVITYGGIPQIEAVHAEHAHEDGEDEGGVKAVAIRPSAVHFPERRPY